MAHPKLKQGGKVKAETPDIALRSQPRFQRRRIRVQLLQPWQRASNHISHTNSRSDNRHCVMQFMREHVRRRERPVEVAYRLIHKEFHGSPVVHSWCAPASLSDERAPC